MRRAPTIRHVLLAVNAFVLSVPIVALFFLPVFDGYLIRQTERILIAEAGVVAEAWRGYLLEELDVAPEDSPRFRPPGLERDAFAPIAAQIDMDYPVLPPAPAPTRTRAAGDDPSSRAGAALNPLLQRAQVFNLSGVRVLDAQGCVVASSRSELGACLDHLEEVQAALAGRYGVVVRQRISDEPPPPLNSIRRRGSFRVFSALPVFLDGQVVGVVRLSRTAVSPLESLWTHWGKIALLLLVCLVVTPAITYLLSHAISSPVRTLTRRAEAIARGEPAEPFVPGPFAPRELRVLSASLERMTAQLRERASYVLEFASNVTHELKTPITAIAGAVELLQDQAHPMSEEQRQRFLANVAEDARRMERLVHRLLQLARIQNVPDEVEQIDVGDFLAALAARYEAPIHVELAPELPALSMNRDHLEAAVRNLIDNAIRHGGGKPIDVSARPGDGGRIAIGVRDRGPGIREAHRARIFDRFFTTCRDEGGTGLGLSIVKAVAETRGGRVELDTGPDGTELRLIL
jgi:signal transduction histidine kinase